MSRACEVHRTLHLSWFPRNIEPTYAMRHPDDQQGVSNRRQESGLRGGQDEGTLKLTLKLNRRRQASCEPASATGRHFCERGWGANGRNRGTPPIYNQVGSPPGGGQFGGFSYYWWSATLSEIDDHKLPTYKRNCGMEHRSASTTQFCVDHCFTQFRHRLVANWNGEHTPIHHELDGGLWILQLDEHGFDARKMIIAAIPALVKNLHILHLEQN
ncbi:hypothetical protein B0H14DRAFT_2578834 [Mycena olivaceomarginata]|nr:hypothetical protein B0H14DRAFT_2578834 [Mycena olivaceomarginata]